MKKEKAVKTAAQWWADKLRKHEPHSNGANDRANVMAMLFADMLTVPVSEDLLDKFAGFLEEEIAMVLNRRPMCALDCDYAPCPELANAAKRAIIPTHNFPYKTSMVIRANGPDNYIVEVSDGYAQPYVEVKE